MRGRRTEGGIKRDMTEDPKIVRKRETGRNPTMALF